MPNFTPPPEWMVRQPDAVDKFGQTFGILNEYAKQRQNQNTNQRKSLIEETTLLLAKQKADREDRELGLKYGDVPVIPYEDAIASGSVPARAKILKSPGSERVPPGQFVGTQNGKPVVYLPERGGQGQFSYGQFPGGGDGGGLGPRNQPTMPGAQVEAISKLKSIGLKADEIQKSWDPNYTGFGQAMIGKAQQFTGFGATPEQGYFRSLLTGISDDLLRAKSGAQINEQEYQRLMAYLPSATTSDVDFASRMKAFKFELNSIMNSKQQSFQGAGYRNTGFIPVGSPTVNVNQGNQPRSVIQNGHTYTLNEETGVYE